MKRYIYLTLVALALIGMGATHAYAWPTVYPTGTTAYLPEKAYNGYILFAPMGMEPAGSSTVHLINMNGHVVHRWTLPFYAFSAQLLPNGNLVAIGLNPKPNPGRPGIGKFWMGGTAGSIAELTWDGKVIFKHDNLSMHHDVLKLPNGNYLYLAWEQVPRALQAKVRGGIKGSEFPGKTMFNDYLVEVNSEGRTVWEWHANAHFDPDIDIIGPLYKREEWSHANSVAVLNNGNILLTSRSMDSLLVISKSTGKVLFRFGNVAYLDKKSGLIEYRSGPNTLGGPHNAVEVPPGYPGAGNFICYDNGLNIGGSRAVEINPAMQRVVWQSGQAGLGRRHFSWFLGSAQRLPNGNILICDGANGRFYQETPQHEFVWEYVNPFITQPRLQGSVYKVHAYAPDYCPQFQQLQAAKGAALVPPSNDLLKLLPDQQPQNQQEPRNEHPDLVPLPLALTVVSVLSLLFYLIRRRQGQSR